MTLSEFLGEFHLLSWFLLSCCCHPNLNFQINLFSELKSLIDISTMVPYRYLDKQKIASVSKLLLYFFLWWLAQSNVLSSKPKSWEFLFSLFFFFKSAEDSVLISVVWFFCIYPFSSLSLTSYSFRSSSFLKICTIKIF